MSTDSADNDVPTEPESGASRTPGWRRALRFVGLLVLFAVVAVFVVYAVPQVIGADHSYVVLTASMSPAIEPGDAVIVGEVKPAAIEEGDVITFHRGAEEPPVTHRVIGITETADGSLYETKGDANADPDANPVAHENVVGSVVVTIPYLGHVIQFVNTTEGFLALVVLPFGLLLLSEAYSFARSPRERGEPETGEGGATGDTGGLVVTPATLTKAAGALAVVAPASAYVAVQYPTAITVTVAVAAAVSLLVTVGIRLVGAEIGGEREEASDGSVDVGGSGSERVGGEDPVEDEEGSANTTDAGPDFGEEPR